MNFETSFLIIAFYLAILSYYLGAFILALPFPASSLKRWGPRLIVDSVLVMGLVLLFRGIMTLALSIARIMGSDWDAFLMFQQSILTHISLWSIILSALSYARLLVGVGRLILWKVLTMLSVNAMIFFLALVIKHNYHSIAALGLALMSIPFRIARGAGSMLFAIALVFTIALPLYPYYLATVFLSPFAASGNEIAVYGRVFGRGGSVDYGYIVAKKDGDELVAKVVNSVFFLFIPEGRTKYEVVFEAHGHLYYTNVSVLEIGEMCHPKSILVKALGVCSLNVYVPGLIYSDDYIGLHSDLELDVSRLNNVGTSVCMVANCMGPSCALYIDVPYWTELRRVVLNNETVSVEREYSWNWHGIEGTTYRLELSSGVHKVCVEYNIVAVVATPEYNYASMASDVYTGDILGTIARELLKFSLMFYAFIVGPTSYLAILLGTSYGLARLLSGTVTRLKLW